MLQDKPLTLRSNFSWTFAGNIVYVGCQWGMLVVLAKIGGPEMVGKFILGTAITAPVIEFANLQLRTVQATDADRQYIFDDYLGVRIISTGVALIFISVITFLIGYPWETTLVILLVGLAKALESISDIFYGLLQQHERMDRIATSMMIKGCLSLLLLGAGVYFSGSVLGGVVGLVIAWSLVLLAYDVRSGSLMLCSNLETQLNTALGKLRLAILIPSRWHWKSLRKLVRLALPLGFANMLITLNTNIPRYAVVGLLGVREVGVFAGIAYIMVAGKIVVRALGQSASPKLGKYYVAYNIKAFRKLIFQLAIVGILLGSVGVIIALFAGENILTLLYKPEYGQEADLFVLLMFAGAIDYVSSFLNYGMTAARALWIQIPLFTLTTIVLCFACLWLIPIFGTKGAAFALIVAAIIKVIFSSAVIANAIYKLHKSKTCV
ncbi:lipopolysaccharide biosynthesis protein [Mastigocoleus testarum]|uniref:Polysaccharide biosynthesis protein n=1 Tax=Mastigocoleus testarum BC008 TaxID=371196 RepID=A0A0V7ZGB4_9CYAN|nr:oligosaccharide flippase family protein [Mastigocoleus testarum]KST63636.1 polysaccharide biosynthesis protein [Mastigocoleus testarum BC008]